MKYIFLILISLNSFSYTGLPEIHSGTVFSKSIVNDRLSFLENAYSARGLSVALDRIGSEDKVIRAEHINRIITKINNLNVLGITIDLVSPGEPITASKINDIFDKLNYVRMMCSTNTECYEKKDLYGQAIRDNEILITQNNFLYSTNRASYLGTKCDSWYTESEISWVDVKLEATKSNYINVSYTSPADQINHIVYNSPAPTCGDLYYYGNQQCRTYGYPYLQIASDVYMSSSVFGNGGCWSGSGTASFNKGDSIIIGSHWGSYVQVYTGY